MTYTTSSESRRIVQWAYATKFIERTAEQMDALYLENSVGLFREWWSVLNVGSYIKDLQGWTAGNKISSIKTGPVATWNQHAFLHLQVTYTHGLLTV